MGWPPGRKGVCKTLGSAYLGSTPRRPTNERRKTTTMKLKQKRKPAKAGRKNEGR